MGRICPILNHPLNDGVLINDEALVSFIQKRNVDFLAHEYVCRSCKREITKLYNKKMKKAIELHRSRYQDGSISTLKTSKDSVSSGASTTSERSVARNESLRKRFAAVDVMQNDKDGNVSQILRQQNANDKNTSNTNKTANITAVSETSGHRLENYNNQFSVLQANQQNPANTHIITLDNLQKNVTMRKKTMKDFLIPISKETVLTQGKATAVCQTVIHDALNTHQININDILAPQSSTTNNAATISNLKSSTFSRYTNDATKTAAARVQAQPVSAVKKKTRHVTCDNDSDDNADDDDVVRRLSQEPTTSKATTSAAGVTSTNSNKRRLYTITQSDDDDDDNRPLSLSAFNGTRLPHIQPLPPKRKSQPDKQTPIARDIMDDYIKDITGG